MNALEAMERVEEINNRLDKLEEVLEITIQYGFRSQEEELEKIIAEYKEEKDGLINRMTEVDL